MFKRITVLVFSFIFMSSILFAADISKPKKKAENTDSKSKKIGYITPDGRNVQLPKLPSPLKDIGIKPGKGFSDAQPLKKILPVGSIPTTEAFEGFIQYAERPYDAGFIFGATDSVGQWFRPVTQCSLLSVFIDFNDDAVGHEYDIEVRRVADHQNGVYDFRFGTEGTFEPMPGFDQDWTGRLMGHYTYTVAAADIVEFPIGVFGLTEEDKDIALNDFAVTWVFSPPVGTDQAQLYGDFPPPLSHHGFKWYSGGHASLGGLPGWVARYNFSIWAKVLYYGDPPPEIADMNDIADQYESINAGPFNIQATVSDLGTDVFTGYVRRIALIMDDDGDAYNADNDTTWVYDQPAGSDVSVNVNYDIINPGVGNSVYYWWYAEDNGAENTGDPEAITHTTESLHFNFTMREKNPDASILLVDDSGTQGLTAQYTDALNAFGYVHDVWITADGDTTSLDILNLYTSIIWFTGTAQGGLLHGENLADKQVAPYLDGGGNLFFNGSDFIGVREDFTTQWTEWTVPTDGFILNYLHVDEILDDAYVIVRGGNEISADTMYTGYAGSITETVVDTFEADHSDFGFYDWSGEVIPASPAVEMMQVDGEYGWDNTGGLVYNETDYKLVYLPWCFESIIDPEIRVQLLNIFLGDVFGENAAPIFSNLDGSRYGVPSGSGPFPISVDVEDNDGSVTSVELGYAIDEGDYTWVAMSGGPTYTGSIPQLTPADTTVAYTVRATDDQGATRYHEDVWWFEQVDFTVVNTGLLYCGDDPYDWYYGGSVDGIVTGTLDDLGATYDYWDVDAWGPPDYYTVLTNYTSAIWHGYADWIIDAFPEMTKDNPFAGFVSDGGNLLFSSEEMIGQSHFDDGSYTFVTGDAAYDILNVEWLGYDWNYDTLRVIDGSYSLTTGMDSILSLEALPFGYMGELIDAIYPWDNEDYFFDAWLAPSGYNNWYSDFGVPGMAFNKDGVIVVPYPIAALDSANRAVFLTNVLTLFGVTTDIKEIAGPDIPKTFALYNNYPNPFNPVTNIKFDLPKSSNVKIMVYNALGQKISTLLDKSMNAGSYSATWNGTTEAGATVASGVYIFRIESPEFVASKKMILMK